MFLSRTVLGFQLYVGCTNFFVSPVETSNTSTRATIQIAMSAFPLNFGTKGLETLLECFALIGRISA